MFNIQSQLLYAVVCVNYRYQSVIKGRGKLDKMPSTRCEEEQSLIMESESYNLDGEKKSHGIIPARFIFTALGCLGFINVYAMRVNLSVAMVAMVNSSESSNVSSNECPEHDKYSNTTNITNIAQETGEFLWDEATQGLILGSFFWGYIFTQIPGGIMAERSSAKWLLGFGVLCTALLTLLTPVAANLGYEYLIAVRVFEGFGEGVTFPAVNAMISRWAPINERGRIVSIVFAGSLLGTVLGLPASGFLSIYYGWQSIFYVFGAIGVAWFVLWALFAYDSPDVHPWISVEEKQYIEKGKSFTSDPKKSLPIPWKRIFTSPALLAIMVAHFGQNWGFYTLLTELPTYLKTILHFDMAHNSIYSALPYLLCWLFSMFITTTSDKLIEKNYLSVKNSRKLCNSIGQLTPAVLLIVLTFAGCDQNLSYGILVVAMTINGSIYGGYQCNFIDIAPNFAGTLMGITNSVATIPGWVGPSVVGALTNDKPFRKQWAIVFYITSAIYFFAAIFYLIFGRGEEQTWNRVEEPEPINSNNEDVIYDKSKKDKRHIS